MGYVAAGQWVLLGEFDFLAGSDGSVTLTHDLDDPHASSADAVMFLPIAV